MLVQRRTEEGLVSNRQLYHKILYKSTDHYPFRIIYSEDPADFADAALPVGPPAAPSVEKKKLFALKKQPRRVVVALGQDRDEVLLDWDTIKKALSEIGVKDVCPADDWAFVYSAVERVVKSEADGSETVFCSAARLTEVPDDFLGAPGGGSSDDDDDEGRSRSGPPAQNTVATKNAASSTRVSAIARTVGVYACTVTAALCTILAGLCLSLLLCSVPASSARLTNTAQIDLSVCLLLFSVVSALQPRAVDGCENGAVSGDDDRHAHEALRPRSGSRLQRPSAAPARNSKLQPAADGNSDKASNSSVSSEIYRKYPVQITVDGCDTIFVPNEAPFRVSTPYFKGEVYAKLLMNPPDPKLAPYFAGKRRKFEIQIQGTFSLPPEHINADGTIKGVICFAASLPQQLKVGFLLRSLWKVILAVFTRLTRGSAITLGTECPGALPAFTGVASNSLDTLVETAPGQTPPPLGIASLPDTGDLARMRAFEKTTKLCPFKLGYVYSCSFHSQNADFVAWTMTNVPGVPTADLRRLWGDNPLRVGFYLLPPGQDQRTAITRGVTILQLQLTNSKLPSYVQF